MQKLVKTMILSSLMSWCWVVAQETVSFVEGVHALPPHGTDLLLERPEQDAVFPAFKGDGATVEQDIVERVNIERLNNGGLPPLKHNALLDQSSEGHSERMAVQNFFSHCDLDSGSRLGDRLSAVGYPFRFGAENIAVGYTNAEQVMIGWMDSPGHRSNILSTDAWEIGVGYVFQSNDTGNVRLDRNTDCVHEETDGPFFHYWTQNFGRGQSIFPVVINREAYRTDQLQVDLYIYGQGTFTEMRLRNNNGPFSDWEPFATQKVWDLDFGDGLQTVTVELRTGGGSTVQSSDSIMLEGSCVTEAAWWQELAEWRVTSTWTVLELIAMRGNFCAP